MASITSDRVFCGDSLPSFSISRTSPASASLLGAVVAWFAAGAGGRHRDGREAVPSYMDWSRRSTYAHASRVHETH